MTTTEQTVDWRVGLPEDLRSDPSILKFNGVEDLARSYVHLQKTVGHPPDRVLVLPEKEEERAVFAARMLGFPEDEKNYSLPLSENVPAEARNGEGVTWFIEQAKALRIPPAAAAKLYEAYLGRAAEVEKNTIEQREKAVAEQIAQLRLEWGQGFDDKVKSANRALAAVSDLMAANGYKGEKLAEVLDKAGLANHPALVHAFSSLSRFFRQEVAATNVAAPGVGSLQVAAEDLTRRAVELASKDPLEARRLAQEAYRMRTAMTGA